MPRISRWNGVVGLGLVLLLIAGLAGLGDLPAGRDDRDAVAIPADGTPVDGTQAQGKDAEPAGTAAAEVGAASIPDIILSWLSPREPSPVEPVPAHERVRKPESVRGLYGGSWSVGSPTALERLIRLADETEINTLVVDIKEALGEVSHPTRVPLAREVGADRNPAIADLRAVVARLRTHGIYPIARIVVFKDPLLATARPEWSIQRSDGSIWADDRGVHWVDPFNRDVWDYNIELAREAVALGFSEIQWDYVRFPDVPRAYLREAVYPARDGRTMADGIREFLIHARTRLDDLDVPLTADVFGVTTSAENDVGIGQLWEKLADVTDVLLPMVYPSHYPRGTWGYPLPNAEPYAIVKRALDRGVARSARIPGSATIRPWLQAFTLGDPPYGPAEIRAQIQAVYDAGLTEWILWNPSARYVREALEPASGL